MFERVDAFKNELFEFSSRNIELVGAFALSVIILTISANDMNLINGNTGIFISGLSFDISLFSMWIYKTYSIHSTMKTAHDEQEDSFCAKLEDELGHTEAASRNISRILWPHIKSIIEKATNMYGSKDAIVGIVLLIMAHIIFYIQSITSNSLLINLSKTLKMESISLVGLCIYGPMLLFIKRKNQNL